MKRLLVVCALMVFGGICLGKDIIISSESCEYRDVSCDMLYHRINNFLTIFNIYCIFSASITL